MLANILITTAILWALTALFVVPLSNYLVARKLREPFYAHLKGNELDTTQRSELEGLTTKYFILSDVLVLGIAGLIGGFLGYCFIGISFKMNGWPGIIAFIGASLAGLAVRSGIV